MKTLKLGGGRELTYELTRKSVKNINFRVKADGVVYVSASRAVPVLRIEELLTERADFLLNAAERLRERDDRNGIGSAVQWLGREYPIRIIQGARETALLEQGECRVFTRRGGDREYVERLIRRAQAVRFEELCRELDAEVRRELSAAGLTPPPTVITIKDMKSRWGSCSYTRGHISINFRLAAYPRETVLSVFWHEYAHYWHHDHSAGFYAFVKRFFPEYDRWNGLLK